MENKTDYTGLCARLEALLKDGPYATANLAKASALLWQELSEINWAGFYLLQGEKLILGPFQGKPACIEIPLGRGVCGTAAAGNQTVLVPDVHKFPGHIACDSASMSEIVVPLFGKTGEVVGVLDIDSPMFARFDENDQAGLENFARIIEKVI